MGMPANEARSNLAEALIAEIRGVTGGGAVLGVATIWGRLGGFVGGATICGAPAWFLAGLAVARRGSAVAPAPANWRRAALAGGGIGLLVAGLWMILQTTGVVGVLRRDGREARLGGPPPPPQPQRLGTLRVE